jgi:hypothetical protein
MELTTERQKQILDEEQTRLAEEQYRAGVRTKLQQPDSGITFTKEPRPTRIRVAIGMLFTVAFAGAAFYVAIIGLGIAMSVAPSQVKDLVSALVPHNVPVDEKIAAGQIVVRAGGYVEYPITVTPEMAEPTVTGDFTASGGNGNDVEAVIVDQANYANWINGHAAQVQWRTSGRQTTGSFEVRLKPGTYYLAVSNKFSLLTDKHVSLKAHLKYKR